MFSSTGLNFSHSLFFLGSNPEFTKLMEYYAAHVPKDGATLSRLPSWLRPYVFGEFTHHLFC